MSRTHFERGFSLIELLMVLTVISLLVRVSLPAYASFRRNAIASQAAADFSVVRAGAFAQFDATGSFPADANGGVTPAGMRTYLPAKFSFRRREYELDWDNYNVASAEGVAGGQVLALTITASDPRLGLQILHTVGANCTHWSVGDSHTFVVLSTLEAGR